MSSFIFHKNIYTSFQYEANFLKYHKAFVDMITAENAVWCTSTGSFLSLIIIFIYTTYFIIMGHQIGHQISPSIYHGLSLRIAHDAYRFHSDEPLFPFAITCFLKLIYALQ